MCSTSGSFVAIDDKREVLLYHLSLGFRWPVPKLRGVLSVSSIHRYTGFIVGSRGKAQLVDIPLTLITQVLCQGLSTSILFCWCLIAVRFVVHGRTGWRYFGLFLIQPMMFKSYLIYQAFQDESESDFMIATAIGDICTIWKTETVG